MVDRTYYENDVYSSDERHNSDYPIYSREMRSRSASQTDTDGSEKREFFIKTVAVQLAVCILIFGMLIVLKKSGKSAFEALKERYNSVMQRDMSMSEITGAFKTAAAFAMKPQGEWKTDSDAQTEESTTEDASNTDAEFTPDDEEILDGTGGEDATPAAENTTFSPVFITEKMISPVDNFTVSCPFGYRTNPISGVFGFHTGIDLACKEGSNIYAVLDGTVKETGCNDVRGNYIVLEHKNNIFTTYYHCSEILAESGAVIRQGEVIAKVGSTGWATGPHLHFEVQIGTVKCNPAFLLDVD